MRCRGVFTVPVQISLNGRDGLPLELAKPAYADDDDDDEMLEPYRRSSLGTRRHPHRHVPPSFTFYPLPSVHWLWPDLTLATGGTLITLHGDGFASFGDLSTTKCRIGVFETRAVYKDGTRVVCEAPPVVAALPDESWHEPSEEATGQAGTTSAAMREEGTVHTVGDRGMADVWLTINDQDYQHAGEIKYFHMMLEEVRKRRSSLVPKRRVTRQ